MKKKQKGNRGLVSILLIALVLIGSFFTGGEVDSGLLRDLGLPPQTIRTIKNLQKALRGSRGTYQVQKTSPYYILQEDPPHFTEEDFVKKADWQRFTPLDSLNRVGVADALIGPDSKPTEKRGDISRVYPTGWKQKKYPFVDGEALYNRCHLIGHQLTGEDANWLNLMTGTRSFNKNGMLPFENLVATYIRETGNQVRYRVSPVFQGDELVARGVYMEGASIEDQGKALSFRVYVPNKEPGVEIDYQTGRSWKAGGK